MVYGQNAYSCDPLNKNSTQGCMTFVILYKSLKSVHSKPILEAVFCDT